MTESVTVYCTRYALTAGIFQLKGRITSDGCFAETPDKDRFKYCFSKPDYKLNRQDAIADFEKRRTAKIANLRKQIAKLEQMTPKIKDDTTTPQETD
jgi:hypothetical protein